MMQKTTGHEWDRESVLEAITGLYEQGEKPTSKKAGARYPGLPRAAKRYYGGWLNALEKSGIPFNELHRTNWTKDIVHREMLSLLENGESLNAGYVMENHPRLYRACQTLFNGVRDAVTSMGLDYSEYGVKQWTEKDIKAAIRKLLHDKKPLNDSWVNKNHSRLYQAARLKYGSWENALREHGIDYDHVIQINKWTPEIIIESIQQMYRDGERLDTAYLKTQQHTRKLMAAGKRHFGTWRRAIEEAGLDYRKIVHYRRKWTETKILEAIRDRQRQGLSLKYVHINKDAPGMSYAAAKLFGSWGEAVEAAGFDYDEIRVGRRWKPEDVLQGIIDLQAAGEPLNPGHAYHNHNNLYSAASRLFGSWDNAAFEARLILLKRNRKSIKTRKLYRTSL